MAVEFKTIRVAHQMEMNEISAGIATGQMEIIEDTKFLMRMVTRWDMKDVDTGEPIAVGNYEQLTRVQFAQVQRAWKEHYDQTEAEVKKTRGIESDSSSS